MKQVAIVVATMAMVSACQPSNTRPGTSSDGACRSDGLYRLNGLTRSADVERTARQVSGARTIRWVAPGEMVTMDFRPDRLTINVDEKGRITAARCG